MEPSTISGTDKTIEAGLIGMIRNFEFIMHNYLCWYYVGTISFLSAIIFAYDKHAAKNNRHRIPERTLHLLEALGGVFANILLMYILLHKNRKFSYWVWTWLMLIGWVILISHMYSIL
jgi:uncharacterized membrane protein YsdA (DUF1294 family)